MAIDRTPPTGSSASIDNSGPRSGTSTSDRSPARRAVLRTGAAAAALAATGGVQLATSEGASAATDTAPDAAPAAAADVTPAPGARVMAGPSANAFGEPTSGAGEPAAAITAVSGSRDGGWSEQKRSEVVARHGAVATSQPLAAQAGLRILQEGGNSVDAAVATAAVLGLTEPGSAGIGGDTFALHYNAADRKLYGLNSSGWSAASWTPEYFSSRGYTAGKGGIPEFGVHSITVPGAVDGWQRIIDRFGRKSLADVLDPAVELAETGFGVSERIHHDWLGGVEELAKDPDSTAVFLRGGKPPALYSVFRNPGLARAYRLLQQRGRDAFYTGPIGDAVVAKINQLGGEFAAADLADFRGEWVDPVTTSYHGYDVYELPPNTQGFATLIMLNVLEQVGPVLGYDLAKLGARSPLFWHLLVEAKKLAYDDLNRYQGDPRFVDVPLDRLLSKEYAKRLCGRIDPTKAHAPEVPGTVVSGTVYLTTADRWGNMTSFIYSVFDEFGSGVTVPGYGFPLQNRGSLFNLDPASPNIVAPHKRPYHTLIPAFVMKDGIPVLSFGNMGGSEQPQAQATELVNMIDLGYNPQAATDAARFYHNQNDNTLHLEPHLRDLVGGALAKLGHTLQDADISTMGGFQAIHFTPRQPGRAPAAEDGTKNGNGPVNGVYRVASDHRKDGAAVGW